MTLCSEDSCDRPVLARGRCSKHYQQWRKTADPSEVRTYDRRGDGRRLSENGYVYIFEPRHPLAHADGYVAEHRKVAWAEGILTDPEMHVHHIDHVKTNNDPSNLVAMWSSDHHRQHAEEDGISNQYGHFPRMAPNCSVEGCDRASRTSGLCSAHYSRLVRWGSVRAELPVVPGQKLVERVPCASPVCDRPAKVLGWCSGHYGRLRLTGDAKPDQAIGRPGRPPKKT